jgi:predicted TIM-barrel fold metal-dependent hydrolase/ketosteroid isomerase-like protein
MSSRIYSSLTIITIFFSVAVGIFAQGTKRSPIVPLGDHHTHILSINAAELGARPIPPAVELPEEIAKLLRDKERLSKERTVAAIKDLYTGDAVVQDVGGPYWLQGDAAVRYVAESTVIARLLPTAFQVSGTSGYVAGIEVTDSNGKVEPASNFLYVIRKGPDGKWRVAVETFTLTGWPVAKVAAEELIAGLDAAGIEHASVLSIAYWYGSAFRDTPVENEYARVRAENDWVAEQTGKYPDRLSAYFSFNPLKDYAIGEIERCAKNPAFKGIKLHLGNGKVNVLDPDHIAKLRAVFAAANKARLPIVVHLWTVDRSYGAPHSKAFLEQVLPAAPDIPIQIAHMAASGPGYHSDDAMEVFANAAAAGDNRLKNVYFDVASMVTANTPSATLDLVTKRLRQVGMKKVLFGSDWVPGRTSNESPQQAWASFRRLPLTDAEFKTVASNVFPGRGRE